MNVYTKQIITQAGNKGMQEMGETDAWEVQCFGSRQEATPKIEECGEKMRTKKVFYIFKKTLRREQQGNNIRRRLPRPPAAFLLAPS